MHEEIENEDLQKATNPILLDNSRNQEKISDNVKQVKDLLERTERTAQGGASSENRNPQPTAYRLQTRINTRFAKF